jgi:hypothetical protein
MRKPAIPLALCLLLAGLSGLAQGDPASLPARDEHEGLLVAADPYTDSERVKKLFGKKSPLDAGIVPIEVVFRNNNDKPILMNLESIELVLSPRGGEKQRLSPLAVEDVIERILYRGGPDVTAKRFPIPGRTNRVSKDKDWLKLESIIRPVALEMSLLPPKATVRGFLFFHVGRGTNWLSYSRLYVAELQFMHNKQPLFFFEVDLSKAVP